MFLLDTNTLIYFFKGQGRVAERLLATSPQQLAVSTITLFELETGLRKSGSEARRAQLAAFAASAQVLPFDSDAATEAADIRVQMELAGTPIGPLDTLIAGTARAARATLVSRNLREFQRVPQLAVENWFD